MIRSPKRPCATPGCGALVDSGFCDKHATHKNDTRKAADAQRPSSSARGYDHRWQQFRAAFFTLAENVMCSICTIKPASEIHHKQKLSARPDLKYELGNLQPLCKRCHADLTAQGL